MIAWPRSVSRGGIIAPLALLLVSGCGDNGSPTYSGAPPTAEATYGTCAFCHRALAVQMLDTGGHGDLDVKCEFCHQDQQPGMAGPGHRSIAACEDCHREEQTHYVPGADTAIECATCHTPHGSTNLFLVRELLRTPEAALAAITFTNLHGFADDSFASRSQPGTGVCEVCHTTTRYYRRDGLGAPHFSYPCFTCHPHSAGFTPR